MDVTNDMLQAAIKKAVEAGLLPRHASADEMRINRDLIRAVLEAAADAAPPARRLRYRRSEGYIREMNSDLGRFAGTN